MLTVDAKISWFSFLPVAACLILLVINPQVAVATTMMAVFILWILAHSGDQDRFVRKMLLTAAVLRAALTIFNHFITIFPVQSDSFLYNLHAMQMVENSVRNLPPFYDSPHSMSIKSYSYFLSLFYRALGEMPLVISMFNTILGILTALLAYRIALLVFKDKPTACFTLVLTLFFPSMIVFTTYVLRDSLIFFLTFLMLNAGMLAAHGEKRGRNTVVAVLSFVVIGIFRIQNFFLFGGFAAAYLLYYLLFIKRGKLIKWLLAGFAVTALAYLVFLNRELLSSVITYPLRAQPLRAEGKSVYLTNLQYRTMFDFIRYSPIRFIYFTFGPFLWNVYSASMLLSAFEGMFLMFMFYFTIQYFHKKRIVLNLSSQWFLLLFCLMGLLANALVDSNFGTSVRHRLPYIIFFFMFAGAYLRDIKFRLL